MNVRSKKREGILDAAMELFAKHGFANVSVDAIAAEAKVSKATVYSHFSGKDALLEQAFEDFLKAQVIPAQTDSVTREMFPFFLREYARKKALILLTPENLRLGRVFYSDVIQSSSLRVSLVHKFEALGGVGLAQVVSHGVQVGAIERVQIGFACDFFYGILKGLIFWPVMFHTLTREQALARVDSAVDYCVDSFLFKLSSDVRSHGVRHRSAT